MLEMLCVYQFESSCSMICIRASPFYLVTVLYFIYLRVCRIYEFFLAYFEVLGFSGNHIGMGFIV